MKKRTKIELMIFAAVAVFFLGSLFAESREQAKNSINTESEAVEAFKESMINEGVSYASPENFPDSTAADAVTGSAPEDNREAAASSDSSDSDDDQSKAAEIFTEGNKASDNAGTGSADITAGTDGAMLPYAGSNMRPIDDVVSEAESVSEDGSYTDRDSVAMYIAAYGHLPHNYISKAEAKSLGWISEKGNLAEVCPGKSIGGDRFGNYEGNLPDKEGRKYFECDINYDPNNGYRGKERIIYSNDGLIYYTDDHYKTFTKLYGDE